MAIDWSNPKSKITPRISVKEACFLNSWGELHIPSEAEKLEIIKTCEKLECAINLLEKKLSKPLIVIVHAFMRPSKANIPGSKWDGKDYNRYVYETQVLKNLTPEEKAKKVVPKSPHILGKAIDFHIVGYETAAGCAEIRKLLLPHLEDLDLRMEDIQGAWVHFDTSPVIYKRFFKP